MGKRSRNRDNMTAAGMLEIKDINNASKEKPVNVKKKTKTSLCPDNATDKTKRIKMDKDQVLSAENTTSDIIEENCTQTSILKNKKKSSKEVDEANITDKSPKLLSEPKEMSKKIKFGEDGEREKDKNEKRYLNDEERAIQDDDIDQFCHDIDEEDNKQYESWISLLEQKLGSNEINTSNKMKKRKKKDKNECTKE